MALQPPRLLIPLLLVVATAPAYHNSLANPFFFDDLPAIVDNANIRTLWPLAWHGSLSQPRHPPDPAQRLALAPAPPAEPVHKLHRSAQRVPHGALLPDRTLYRPPRPGWPDYNLGLALRSIGRSAEAVAYFRRASALAPDSDAARSNLQAAVAEASVP